MIEWFEALDKPTRIVYTALAGVVSLFMVLWMIGNFISALIAIALLLFLGITVGSFTYIIWMITE